MITPAPGQLQLTRQARAQTNFVWARGDTRKKVLAFFFGIVAPLACLIFDPIVFNDGVLSCGQPFAYGFIALCCASLGVWMLERRPIPQQQRVFCGIFTAAATGSFLLGLAMLPMSLIGLRFGIGVLGFTPLCTAYVYYRAMKSAYETARHFSSDIRLKIPIMWGAVAALAVPALFQLTTAAIMRKASPPTIESRASAAFYYANTYTQVFGGSFLLSLYWRESDPTAQARLGTLYEIITGKDIRSRD